MAQKTLDLIIPMQRKIYPDPELTRTQLWTTILSLKQALFLNQMLREACSIRQNVNQGPTLTCWTTTTLATSTRAGKNTRMERINPPSWARNFDSLGKNKLKSNKYIKHWRRLMSVRTSRRKTSSLTIQTKKTSTTCS